MSREFQTTVTCPECGEKIEVTVWESLNRQVDSEAADRLMAGGFFHVKCPKCEFEGPFFYRMLYHDMDRATMVQFVPPKKGESSEEIAQREAEQHLQSILAMKEKTPTGLFNLISGGTFRVVTNHVDLMEKARLLRAKLDDRVVELMKVLIRRSAKRSYPDLEIQVICFDDEEKKGPGFILLGQEDIQVRIEFFNEVYEELLGRCQQLIPNFDSNSEVLVNEAWAEKTLEDLEKEKESC